MTSERDETIPAAPESLYRFLRIGELVEAGDECPDDDAMFWEPIPSIFVGHPVARIFKTIRRRASRTRDEAIRREAAEIIVRGRTPEAFMEESEKCRARWTKFARAAIAATLTLPARDEEGREPSVSIPLDVAKIIDGAFLPGNPNRMRNAAPETIAAAYAFKAALREREGGGNG